MTDVAFILAPDAIHGRIVRACRAARAIDEPAFADAPPTSPQTMRLLRMDGLTRTTCSCAKGSPAFAGASRTPAGSSLRPTGLGKQSRVSLAHHLVFTLSSVRVGLLSDLKPLGVILLVEDEPLVRLVAADLLTEAHFRVIEAADAQEALTVLKAEVEVDVVLSDVEMPPGMNGYELAWQIHRDWPCMGIVMSSGREWPRANDLPPGAVFLAKPYSHATLMSHVLAATERAQTAKSLADQQRRGDEVGEGTAPPVPKSA